jgi:hypothetical protein
MDFTMNYSNIFENRTSVKAWRVEPAIFGESSHAALESGFFPAGRSHLSRISNEYAFNLDRCGISLSKE